jgi:DNA-binding GntR family transcriptional regulator
VVRSGFRTKTEDVAVALRRAINRGEIAAGERVAIIGWAARLKVSPTPLREALRTLESEGFVTFFPQRGFQANALSVRDVSDAYLTFEMLANVAAELTIERLSETDRVKVADTLCELTDRLREALHQQDYETAYKANYRFFRLLYKSADSPFLERVRSLVFKIIPSQMRPFWQFIAASADRIRNLTEERRLVAEALAAGDRGLMAKALQGLSQVTREFFSQGVDPIGTDGARPANGFTPPSETAQPSRRV